MMYQDGAEHRHGDDVGGQCLAANLDELIAVDGCNADHPARQNGAMRRLEARVQHRNKPADTLPRASAKICREYPMMMPWKDATSPNKPSQTSMCSQPEFADDHFHGLW
jgi:hypothetical protein